MTQNVGRGNVQERESDRKELCFTQSLIILDNIKVLKYKGAKMKYYTSRYYVIGFLESKHHFYKMLSE